MAHVYTTHKCVSRLHSSTTTKDTTDLEHLNTCSKGLLLFSEQSFRQTNQMLKTLEYEDR